MELWIPRDTFIIFNRFQLLYRLVFGGGDEKFRSRLLAFSVVVNLSILAYFKYAIFVAENVFFRGIPDSFDFINNIVLPVGISFFTFQAISYVVDVYRRELSAERSLIRFGAYLSFFPQLIAGPIVRFKSVAEYFHKPQHSAGVFAQGAARFTHGLMKKVLVADTAGRVADASFLASQADPSFWLSWVAAASYALQIYFDFSAYSDMAIGLGLMFGIRFPENFRRPYVASTITDFWRRWHITLSTWFRDYLYIPLGGNRVSSTRLYINLSLVFLATGVWHGAAWTFVVWGMFHGAFIIGERVIFGADAPKIINPWLRYFYLIPVVLIGWVLFRATSLEEALSIISHMIRVDQIADALPGTVQWELDPLTLLVLALATCVVLGGRRSSIGEKIVSMDPSRHKPQIVYSLYILFAFIASIVLVLSSQYSPFLYFRF